MILKELVKNFSKRFLKFFGVVTIFEVGVYRGTKDKKIENIEDITPFNYIYEKIGLILNTIIKDHNMIYEALNFLNGEIIFLNYLMLTAIYMLIFI